MIFTRYSFFVARTISGLGGVCSIQLSYGNVYFIVFIPYVIRTSVLNEVFARRLLVHYLRRRMLYPAELLARMDISSILLIFCSPVKNKGRFFADFSKIPLYIFRSFGYNKLNYANTTK